MAWNGPTFLTDKDQNIKLTVPVRGTLDKLHVALDDDDHEMVLDGVGPSVAYPGMNELKFHHTAGNEGIVGVQIWYGSDLMNTYEFEFRDTPQGSAEGALIESQSSH